MTKHRFREFRVIIKTNNHARFENLCGCKTFVKCTVAKLAPSLDYTNRAPVRFLFFIPANASKAAAVRNLPGTPRLIAHLSAETRAEQGYGGSHLVVWSDGPSRGGLKPGSTAGGKHVREGGKKRR